MELNNQILGVPITEELSDLLKKYTDSNDRADVSFKTRVGTSTIRDVVYRTNTLTESNSKAIRELTIVALKNCAQQIKESSSNVKELKKFLNTKENEQIKAS